jgi:hypothetical protein
VALACGLLLLVIVGSGCGGATSVDPPPIPASDQEALASIRIEIEVARAIRRLGRASVGIELCAADACLRAKGTAIQRAAVFSISRVDGLAETVDQPCLRRLVRVAEAYLKAFGNYGKAAQIPDTAKMAREANVADGLQTELVRQTKTCSS